MKTLKTIQVLSKIGKILSKIAFICSLVGFCGCVAGMISLALGAETLKLGGLTLKSILQKDAATGMGTVYGAITVGLILCAGEAVLSKFAEHYFKRELADGTPFHLDGAKELFRLGILTIIIPLVSRTIAEIAYAVISRVMTDVAPLQMNESSSVTLGIMFIVMSVVCKYGAECTEPAETK